MTRPRSQLVSLDTTPYYHCISRCVRRAFLMGTDECGRSFDHRKAWLVARIKFLAEIFAVDVAAYAVMSNHYHLVLHVNKARAEAWIDDEVCKRWGRLYHGPELLQRHLNGEMLASFEQKELKHLIVEWRGRLACLSHFMACLNYIIALRGRKGHPLKLATFLTATKLRLHLPAMDCTRDDSPSVTACVARHHPVLPLH